MVYTPLKSFMKKLLLRFLLPRAIQGTHVSSIDLDHTSLYLPTEEVFVGDKARRYLLGEHDLVVSEMRGFYETYRLFWLTAAKYAMKKLPIDSDFLASLSWLYPSARDYGNLNQVLAISRCLSQVIP